MGDWWLALMLHSVRLSFLEARTINPPMGKQKKFDGFSHYLTHEIHAYSF